MSTTSSHLREAGGGQTPLLMMSNALKNVNVKVMIGVLVFRNWTSLFLFFQKNSNTIYWVTCAAVAVLLLRVLALGFQSTFLRQSKSVSEHKLHDNGLLPLFWPCQTTHVRLLHKVESYTYSYLLTGIPVDWEGSIAGLLGTSHVKNGIWEFLRSGSSNSWFSINAGNYLGRGHGDLGLRGKLDHFLVSKGKVPEDFPYAYLMTAADFLGFSFNPVSFWYLYSKSKELVAMILEVNNTFDERHMYLLDVEKKETASTNSNKFTQVWEKQLHLSPFLEREGLYSMMANDPFSPSLTGMGPVSVSVTLKSPQGRPVFVGRIYSQGSSVDPNSMTFWDRYRFLAAWWWVGLATLPRTLYQAFKFDIYHKPHVITRPEPLKDSISRRANKTEKVLASTFRNYLAHLVRSSPANLVVKYTASGLFDAEEETFESTLARSSSEQADILDFKVLTPLFYSRFVYYAHDLEAIFNESLQNKTIWLSRPDLLPNLVLRKPPLQVTTADRLNYLCFLAIKKLRQRPPSLPSSVSTRGSQAGARYLMSDIRNFRLSAMDGFVLAECPVSEQQTYRTQVLKLFISDRVAFGSIALLEVQIFLLRLVVAAGIAQILQKVMERF